MKNFKDKVNYIIGELDWCSHIGEGYDLFFGNLHDWNQTLITKINQCSAHIHKKSLSGGATDILCSKKGYEIIRDMEYYHEYVPKKVNNIPISLGSLAGRYEVELFEGKNNIKQLLIESIDNIYTNDIILVYSKRDKIGLTIKIT